MTSMFDFDRQPWYRHIPPQRVSCTKSTIKLPLILWASDGAKTSINTLFIYEMVFAHGDGLFWAYYIYCIGTAGIVFSVYESGVFFYGSRKRYSILDFSIGTEKESGVMLGTGSLRAQVFSTMVGLGFLVWLSAVGVGCFIFGLLVRMGNGMHLRWFKRWAVAHMGNLVSFATLFYSIALGWHIHLGLSPISEAQGVLMKTPIRLCT